jgi:hypothetical protein
MKKRLLLIYILLILSVSIGCSKNIKVTGHVTFTDGEPVNFGSVCFETSENTYSARLDKNGYYSIGDTKDGAGIPEGAYRIWLSGTVLTEDIPNKNNDGYFEVKETMRVHPKYTLPNHDSLKFEVKRGGKTTFDFTVERPDNPKNKSKR